MPDRSSTTTWACSGCGRKEQGQPNGDMPAGWESFSRTVRAPSGGYRTTGGTFCQECVPEARRKL